MASSSWITIENVNDHWASRAMLPALCMLFVCGALYLIFQVVPGEQVMGDVQRLFYFHFGTAITSYVMIALLLTASSFYLVTKEEGWDLLAQSAAGVAFLFCSLVLLTGMIWGHFAWNAWWRWEPRLVTSLVLWLMLAGYVSVRGFSAGHSRQKSFLSVIGIVAACFVPVVIYSVRMMSQNEQLHPQVVGRQGLTDPSYKVAVAVSAFALIFTGCWLVVTALSSKLLDAKLQLRRREYDQLRWEWENGVRK